MTNSAFDFSKYRLNTGKKHTLYMEIVDFLQCVALSKSGNVFAKSGQDLSQNLYFLIFFVFEGF